MTRSPGSLPDDDVERWVIEVCESLGAPVEDGEGDFFEAGATSLTALKLIARAEARYGDDALPPDDLYAGSRVKQIAECIRRNGRPISEG